MKKRSLTLRRETLAEIDRGDLAAVAGGLTDTCFSCLDYISCNPLQCIGGDTFICAE